MGISKITRNFQVTLPKDIRELKSLEIGDKILLISQGEKIEMIKLDTGIVEKAAGLWNKEKATGLEYERRLRKTWKNRGGL
ncbi:MAG TPA: AbrB/MazE/SpoVT family DNA-binding domain-containing protein [Candidatus Nanoarchaeia archaeon]|nr:AbrB/MazE/SpoVT family DNA-binding domain-containing protein [Candidatus Nanoarchaeia archaeon]